MAISRQLVLSTFMRAIKTQQRHAKSGQSMACLAVIYIAPLNLDQIGACASQRRHIKIIRSDDDRHNYFTLRFMPITNV